MLRSTRPDWKEPRFIRPGSPADVSVQLIMTRRGPENVEVNDAVGGSIAQLRKRL